MTRCAKGRAVPLRCCSWCVAAGRAAAKDPAEETFARACAAFGKVEPRTSVTAWLYRILITAFAASSGKQQREPQPVHASGGGDRRARAGSFTRGRPTRAQIQAVERLPGSHVNGAMHELPPDLRMVVYLADVEDFTCREIGASSQRRPRRSPHGSTAATASCGNFSRDYAVEGGPGTSKPARNDFPPAASPGRRHRSAIQAHRAGQAKAAPAAPASIRGHVQAQP